MPRAAHVFALSAFTVSFGFASADPLLDIAQCSQISSSELRLICYDAAASALKSVPPATPATPPAPQANAIEATPPAPSQSASAPPIPVAPTPAAQAPVAETKSRGWIPTFGLFGGKKKDAPAQVATAQTSQAPVSQEAAFGAGRLPTTETSKENKPKPISSIRSNITDYAYTPFDRIIIFLENGQVWRQIDGDSKKLRLRKGQSYTAEIDKGMLGSFNLAVDGIDGMVKVTRIK